MIRRHQHKQHKRKQSAKSAITLPTLVHDSHSQVLRLPEVARLADIGLRTLRRQIESGRGPRIVHLSDQRRGITVKAYNEWIAAREQRS
jgi:predicted DNA-binding transcriptional regulator AlpA